jgi:glyoxylase-like metal-dependent hydrolase (beta-lactamase superfamily II)
MEQVADGIHRLGSRAHNFYIIAEGDEATIVDLGCRREWKSLIGGLAALGLGPASVSAALATHAHGDHLGLGARAKQEGIDVRVHRDDEVRALGGYQGKPSATASDLPLYRLAVWRNMLPMLIRGATRWDHLDSVSTFDDAEAIDIPGRPVVVHTPGHTEGHAMFHCPDVGVLFTGDGIATMDLVGDRTGPQLMDDAFNNDTDQAYESLERLEMIDADLLLPGHGRPFEGTPAQAVELARRYRQS